MNYKIALRLITIIIAFCAISANMVGVVHAQPNLVEASPKPDAVLGTSPAEVNLLFDRALSDEGTRITVTNQDGARVDNGDAFIDPANRSRLTVTLQLLVEGRYEVSYQAASFGSSTILSGTYTFEVDLPDPQLSLLWPTNGAAYQSGESIHIEMQAAFFSFSQYDYRARIYVDQQLVEEVRGIEATLEGLEPGVHEIRVVLARHEDEELSQTSTIVYVAVAHPDTELEGRELAAVAPPDPGLQLSTAQLTAVIAFTILLISIGILLGRLA